MCDLNPISATLRQHVNKGIIANSDGPKFGWSQNRKHKKNEKITNITNNKNIKKKQKESVHEIVKQIARIKIQENRGK